MKVLIGVVVLLCLVACQPQEQPAAERAMVSSPEPEVVEYMPLGAVERRASRLVARVDRSTREVHAPLPPPYDYHGERSALAYLSTTKEHLRQKAEYERQKAEWEAQIAAADVERRRVAEAASQRAGQPRGQGAPSPAAPSGGVWDRLAQCESGGNWATNTGNGYYGGLQFLPSTWRSVGGTGLPHEHSREEQIRRGQILQRRSGWGQWPACSRKLGLR